MPWPGETTENLVNAVKEGEEASLTVLVKRYERLALSVAFQVVGDYHDAQDVVQEAFLAATQKIGTLREPAAFGPWIAQIVRRRAERVRTKKPKVVSPTENETPALDEQNNETLAEVLSAISTLPQHEQDVVLLRFVDGESVSAIAAITRRPVGTITKQLSRAVARLKNKLAGTNQ